ncbi:MAG TPA: hypothetical protein VMT30_06075 [Candidatus Saccharimonadia bacterium]|nr:hypothetical protein [Candidatus Saccharimonadia bacterium]
MVRKTWLMVALLAIFISTGLSISSVGPPGHGPAPKLPAVCAKPANFHASGVVRPNGIGVITYAPPAGSKVVGSRVLTVNLLSDRVAWQAQGGLTICAVTAIVRVKKGADYHTDRLSLSGDTPTSGKFGTQPGVTLLSVDLVGYLR